MENNENSRIATVEDLVKHLMDNFRLSDILCYWHEGGAWCECEHIHKNDLENWMLYKVKDEKKRRLESGDEALMKYAEHDYRNVNDEDVVIY